MDAERAADDDPAEPQAKSDVTLRRRAEAAARTETGPQIPTDVERLSPDAIARLLHEVRVHQIELELQNEELRRTRTELEDARARYFDLYELAPVGYLRLDANGFVVEANLTAASILGAPRSVLIDRPLARHVLAEDQPVYYAHRRLVLKSSELQFCEVRLIKRDGDPETWVRLETIAATEPDGSPCSRTVVVPITDRKEAEEALRASEALYRALVESMSDGVAVSDASGRFTAVNGALARRLGRTPEDIIGRSVRDVYPPDRAQKIRDLEKQVVGDGRLVEDEYETNSSEGRRYWEERHNPLRDSAGRITGVVSVSRDVTERVRLQAKLHQSERLELAGRIAGQVAHDLNNLLSPLVAFPDLIKTELPPDHPAVDYCDTMMRSAQRAAEISDDLLTLARRGHVEKRPIDLNAVVLEVESSLGPIPPDLRVEHDLSANLLPVLGSSAQLGRVVSNLVANAREAMHDRGVLHISTAMAYDTGSSSVPRGDYVALSVADTGSGIQPQHQDRVFDPFFTTRTEWQGRGAGLGLSIVRSVVEDHGGHVKFETEVGRGTTFTAYLPVDHSARLPKDGRPVAGGTETVLVVDADSDQRAVADTILSPLGYQVIEAEDGESALSLIGQSRVDLVILDMLLPGEWDGAETLRRIREIYPRQRALMVFGYARVDRVQEAVKLGAGAHLRKPLTARGLAAAVRSELDRPESE